MTFMSLFVACTDDDDDASGTDSGFTEEVVVVNPACDDYTYQLKTELLQPEVFYVSILNP